MGGGHGPGANACRPLASALKFSWSAVPMSQVLSVTFADERVLSCLQEASDAEIDSLDFGVIGFDAECVVRRYNAFESRAAGLSLAKVIGHPLFTVVAPCMNNFLVAQRFEDAAALGQPLDATIDYVLTLRMRPVKVRLRLLAEPGAAVRYVLVQRAA
jgi:photoactive yellow protein